MTTTTPTVYSTGFNIGIRRISRQYLEAHRENGSMLRFKALGMVIIDEDVPMQLARETLQRVKVYGMLIATPAVNVALTGCIKVIGFSIDHLPQPQTETR